MMGFTLSVILSLLASVLSEKILILDEPLSTEILSLAHLHPQFRQKRSTDSFSFPEKIDLNFPLGETHVNIPLERREFRGIPNIIKGFKIGSTLDIAKTHAMYQNPEKGAAITMRCQELSSESCEMYGTFYHEGGLYQLQPINVGIYSDYEVSRIKAKQRRFSNIQVTPEMMSKMERSTARYTASHNINKRAVADPSPPAYVAELYLAIDFALYSRFSNMFGSAADANIILYATGIVNEVDTRTRNIRVQFVENRQGRLIQDFDLGVVLNTLEVCTDPASCTWSSSLVSNGVLGESSLQAFSTFLSGLTGADILYDFAVGLTVYDTTDSTHAGLDLAGIYYTEGDLCINTDLSLVASITEVNEGGAGFNIAHFLGRHFGLLGDGEAGVTCALQNFIMSPTWDPSLANAGTMSNPYRWSLCSLGSFYNRIQG
ncbi:uncharacterized protein LOC117330065 [Pecten maximus]|uniref:uncharacterized protein LOC117330065 n=1 Tax=Pecten maximus TaxID=6579 RepID=UPI001458A935|nr:uncharacterized protein LOC117330065 [Pecten maximus]